MNFECNRKELKEKLELVSGVIQEKSPKDGLSSVLIRSELPDKLYLYGTNMDTNVLVVTHQCRVDEEFKFLVPAKLFSNIVNCLKTETVSMELENKLLTITSDKTVYHISTQDQNGYPMPEWDRPNGSLVVNFDEFKKAINSVIPFAGNNGYRLTLSGILLELKENELRLVSTDGNRLMVYTISNDNYRLLDETNESRFIVPKSAMETAVNLDTIDMLIRFSNSKIKFETEDVWITSSLIIGNYPQYEKVIPTEFIASATVDRNELKNAIQRIIPICRTANNSIKFTLDDNKLVLSSRSQSGVVLDEIPAETNGSNFSIMLDAIYVSEFLSLGKWPVKMEFTGKDSAVKFTSTVDTNIVYVIMPLVEEG